MGNEVTLTVTMNRPQYAATGEPQVGYCLVEAMPAVSINMPMPLNFCFVLDHSGSMDGEKLDKMKRAAKHALSLLKPNDVVSVIEFDDNVKVIAPSQAATNIGAIQQQIDRMRSAGGTEISKAIKLGLDELRKQLAPNRVNRMLLLTDGQTNGDEKRCADLASECKQLGVGIAVYGLGDDWNEQLLEQIALNSGGSATYIEQPDLIAKEFQGALQQAQGEVVQNARLLLRLVAGCVPRNAWRVIPAIQKLSQRAMSDREVVISLGSLDAQLGGSVLVELMLPARSAGSYRIAQADLTFDVPALNQSNLHALADVMLDFTQNTQASTIQVPRIANLIEKVSAFNLQTRALEDLRTGNASGATQKLRAAATRLLDLGENDLAKVAQQEADNIAKQGKMTDLGTKKLNYGTRKLTQKLDD